MSAEKTKTILITGASSGFGKLAVVELLERGHTVIAALRGGQERLDQLFSNEKILYPDRLFAFDLHLEKTDAPAAISRFVEEKFNGKLDVLVNNAGYGLFGAIEDQTPEQLRHQFEVNFFGPVFLARALLPALRRSRGRVIFVSSVVGLYTLPFYTSYSATKYAIEAVGEGLYYELESLGVKVALVEPGGFKTEFNERSKIFAEPSQASPHFRRIVAMKKLLARSSSRLGDPKKVGEVIANLCEKERIPLRTLVGYDAWFFRMLGRLVPDSLRTWFIERVARLVLR